MCNLVEHEVSHVENNVIGGVRSRWEMSFQKFPQGPQAKFKMIYYPLETPNCNPEYVYICILHKVNNWAMRWMVVFNARPPIMWYFNGEEGDPPSWEEDLHGKMFITEGTFGILRRHVLGRTRGLPTEDEYASAIAYFEENLIRLDVE